MSRCWLFFPFCTVIVTLSYPIPTRFQSQMKILHRTPDDLFASDVLNPIASEHPLGPVKIHLKAKTSNACIWFDVFLGSATRSVWNWWARGNIDIRVSKLCFMDFSSINGPSCIWSENQFGSTHYDAGQNGYEGNEHWTQNLLECEIRKQVRISEKSWPVICIQTALQKSRHICFREESSFNEKIGEKVSLIH